MRAEVENEIISNEEVSNLYLMIPGYWVLLAPLETNSNGKATKLKVLKYDKNKDTLREFVMDHEDWEETGTLIYFFTGFDGTCKL